MSPKVTLPKREQRQSSTLAMPSASNVTEGNIAPARVETKFYFGYAER